jgi:hypothetical protein
MDAVRAVLAVLWSTALQATTALQSSVRALIGWAVGIASRQANLVAILGQSLTLCLLTLVISYLRKPETRVESRCIRGPEKP